MCVICCKCSMGTRKGPGWEMGYLAKLVWVSSLPLPLGETGDLED